MSHAFSELDHLLDNPLDVLEQLAMSRSWACDRSGETEFAISIPANWCDLQLSFSWRPEIDALHLAATFDLRVPKARWGDLYPLIGKVNEQLLLGHFDLWSEDGTVMFRHTSLLGHDVDGVVGMAESLVQLAFDACERYYPAFQLLLWAGKTPDEALSSCFMEVEGRA